MLKKYNILFGSLLILIATLTMVTSYTAPTFDSLNSTSCSAYITPTLDSLNSTSGLEHDACAPVDTCACAGLNTNWEVNMSDFCVVTEVCDLGTGKLSFVGTGNFTIDAIISTTDMGDPGSSGIIWMNDEGVIFVS